MDKKVIRIFILGFIWVITGAILTYRKAPIGTLLLAIGLTIESIALLLFFWKKMKGK